MRNLTENGILTVTVTIPVDIAGEGMIQEERDDDASNMEDAK